MAGGIPIADAIFWGIITFSFLVVIHEGGHFIAARLFKVKVDEFMLGLPGPAVRIKTKTTTFGVTMIPLGGYVRIAGMEPGPEDELLGPALAYLTEVRRTHSLGLAQALGVPERRASGLLTTLQDWGAAAAADDDDVSYVATLARESSESDAELLDRARAVTYRGRKTWQRIVILAAGVAINILTAILVFTVVLTFWGAYEATLTIDEVQKGSAAESAGLAAGDTLVELGGEELRRWEDLPLAVERAGAGALVEVVYERDGRTYTTSATLKSVDGQAMLGVSSGIVKVDYNVFQAFAESLRYTGLVFVAIVDFFRPSTFAASVEGARSVVGISVEAARAAKAGPLDYAALVALLSLSLGILNILPIPPLDGGKVAMELVERVIGRPLRREFTLAVSAAGALLLFSLIGYLMYADVLRYGASG